MVPIMKKLLIPILILFFLNTLTFAQLIVKDQDATPHTLLQVNDEGVAGSITLNQLSTIGTATSKLYNLGGVLYWAGSPLATGGSSPWIVNGSNIYYTAGNVGIGLTDPLDKLHLSGDFRIDDASPYIQFYSGTTQMGSIGFWTDNNLNIINRGATSPIVFATNAAEKMRITAEGNVGIGTAVPTTRLTIFHPTSSYAQFQNTDTGTETYSGLKIGYDNGTAEIFNLENSSLNIGTNNTTRMTISGDGKVGIGTNSPSGPLHIKLNGTAIADGIRLATSLTTGEDWYFYMDPNDDLTIANDASPYVTFQKNTGNVGIGTQNPQSKLSVGGDGYTNTTIYGANTSEQGRGVYGAVDGNNAEGVFGYAYGSSSSAIYGWSAGGGSSAGYFSGSVHVTGTLSKGGGSFKIDHPLDPTNKNLYHSFVESPDMMNIYNGNIELDANGEAVVIMDEWFEALNMDFRYQLTCIGGFAPVYISEKINGNLFKIAGGNPGLEVSWQVTGIRHDAFANANRIKVEEMKDEKDRGKYLHPEAFNMPKTASVDYDQKLEAERELMKGER